MPHISRQNVRIVQRTLWIGQDTYPLHNVVKTSLRRVRVTPRVPVPGRATRWGFGLSLLGAAWLLTTGATQDGPWDLRALHFAGAAGHLGLLAVTFRVLRGRPPFPRGWKWPIAGLAVVAGPAVVAWALLGDLLQGPQLVLFVWPAFALLTWSLLSRPPAEERTYHQLVITTNGGASTRLTSDDGRSLQRLRGALTRAINDPKAGYTAAMNVYEFTGGDNVVVVGDNNVGMVKGHGTGISRG